MKKTIFTLCCAIASLMSMQAQETLSLDSCVAMALRSNREIREAQLKSEQYRHTRKAYFANFLPDLSAHVVDLQSFNGTQSLSVDLLDVVPATTTGALQQLVPALAQTWTQLTGQPFPAEMLSGLDHNVSLDYKIGNVFHGSVSLTQPLYMGGKITAAYRMSQLGERMAQLGMQLTEDEVIVQTHEAYSLLLQASQMHEVAASYDSLLSKLLTDVQNAERHGMRSHNDVLKVQVKKSEAELQILQARNGIRLAQMNLCHYIGLPLGQDVRVREVAVSDDQAMALRASVNGPERNLSLRPEYNLLELKSELAAQQVKLTRSDFMPQLALMANYGYTNGLEVVGQKLLHKPGAVLAVNLTVPIYHGGEAQHKVKAARLEYERTVIEQQDLVEKLNLELQQSANQLEEAILEVEITHKTLDQAADNLRSSRKAFDLGLESLSDLLEAQTLWQQAYARKAAAECALIVAEVKYRKACGTL